jgi:hypothetical protein
MRTGSEVFRSVRPQFRRLRGAAQRSVRGHLDAPIPVAWIIDGLEYDADSVVTDHRPLRIQEPLYRIDLV